MTDDYSIIIIYQTHEREGHCDREREREGGSELCAMRDVLAPLKKRHGRPGGWRIMKNQRLINLVLSRALHPPPIPTPFRKRM